MKVVSGASAYYLSGADGAVQTNGEGATHIVEVGGPGTLAKSFKCVAYGGWIHAVGFIAHDPDAEVVNPVVAAILRGCSLRGVLVGSVAQ